MTQGQLFDDLKANFNYLAAKCPSLRYANFGVWAQKYDPPKASFRDGNMVLPNGVIFVTTIR